MSLDLANAFALGGYVVLGVVAFYMGYTGDGIFAESDTDEFWLPVFAFLLWVILAWVHIFWIVGNMGALLINMVVAMVVSAVGATVADRCANVAVSKEGQS